MPQVLIASGMLACFMHMKKRRDRCAFARLLIFPRLPARSLFGCASRLFQSIACTRRGLLKISCDHGPPVANAHAPLTRRHCPKALSLSCDIWQLASLVTALESCGEFGFDLEAHNARTYHGLTCLLQISTEAKVCLSPCSRADGRIISYSTVRR